MLQWLREFEQGTHHFQSPAVHLEVQLRKALAATASSFTGPDAFRLAAVCECLSRLPEAAGGFSRILQLIRAELMRAIYIDFDGLESREESVDGRSLFCAKTYFARVDELLKENSALQDRFAAMQSARLTLQKESEARAHMLKLALERWNKLTGLIKQDLRGSREAQEAVDRLSHLLASMEEHCEAIDEMERIATSDPETRLHETFSALSSTSRNQMVKTLLEEHGAAVLGSLHAEERTKLLLGLLSQLQLADRQQLMRELILSKNITGQTLSFLDLVNEKLDYDDLSVLLKQTANRCKRILGGGAPYKLGSELKQIISSISDVATVGTQAPASKSVAEREQEVAILADKLGEHSVAALEAAREYLQRSASNPDGMPEAHSHESEMTWPLLVGLEHRCAELEHELDLQQSSAAQLKENLAQSNSREEQLQQDLEHQIKRRGSMSADRDSDAQGRNQIEMIRAQTHIESVNGPVNIVRLRRSSGDIPNDMAMAIKEDTMGAVNLTNDAAVINARGRAITHQEAAVEAVLKRHARRRSDLSHSAPRPR
ncbi:MAG: hypothetical protein SGPRY_001300 [Prymnesium sp.]